jgi:hypothetical protein
MQVCALRSPISRLAAGEAALRERLERARLDGGLLPDDDPTDLTRSVVTVVQGMSVQAASGASRDEMQRVIQTVMRVWPE